MGNSKPEPYEGTSGEEKRQMAGQPLTLHPLSRSGSTRVEPLRLGRNWKS